MREFVVCEGHNAREFLHPMGATVTTRGGGALLRWDDSLLLLRFCMHWDPQEFKHQELTRLIIQVFYEVYNELGHGFLEFTARDISVTRQRPLPVWFRGQQIGDFHPILWLPKP